MAKGYEIRTIKNNGTSSKIIDLQVQTGTGTVFVTVSTFDYGVVMVDVHYPSATAVDVRTSDGFPNSKHITYRKG